MKALAEKLFIFFIAIAFVIGCTSELDFDQAEDLSLEPVIESSFIFYQLSAEEINTEATSQSMVAPFMIRDTVALDLFNESFLNDNLIRIDITRDTENSTDEDVEVVFNYVDDSFEPTVAPFSFDAPANTDRPGIVTSYQGEDLELLKRSTQIVAELVVSPTQSAFSDSGLIEIRSKATLYLRID